MNFVELASKLEVVNSATFDQDNVGGEGARKSDLHASLVIMMNLSVQMSRGIAVVAVVSEHALKVIESGTASRFGEVNGQSTSFMKDSNYKGTLNNSLHVVVDPDADELTPVRIILYNKDNELVVSEVHLKNISF